ncbi:hypothetical protein ACHAQA_003859 [Verticillium albo-atrum]
MTGRVFFITGTSSGFGHQLVKKALQEGDFVVATARNAAKLKFDDATVDNFLGVDCDVTSEESVDEAFSKATERFRRVDVVVNNAGYGLAGEFESISNRQAHAQMDVNFFGVLNVTRAALKVMRVYNTPVGGRILQVSSIGGQRGAKMFSIYAASKWAVEGFTESVSKELKPEWNIKFVCVEPGYFRTNWGSQSMEFGEQKDSSYDHIDARDAMQKMQEGKVGDPVKAARAFWELSTMENPPPRAVLGSDAYRGITAKISEYKELFENPVWKEFAHTTDEDSGS